MTDISKAEKIDGWMSHDELLWLAEIASKSTLCVEVGTYLGRSTYAIGSNLPETGVLYTIDPYLPYSGPDTGSPISTVEQGQEIRSKALSNLRDLIANDSVRTCSSNHECLLLLDGSQPDFVFIDGSHDYLSVVFDIQFWARTIEEGGTIAGHDYNVFDGVNKAVREIFPKQVTNPVGSIWSVKL